MALTYKDLSDKYNAFQEPVVELQVGDKLINSNKKNIGISNLVVDLTSGFEASQCTYSLYNCYHHPTGRFVFDTVKDFCLIGSPVTLSMGYDTTVKNVFKGVITKVTFHIEDADEPHIEVTCMDVKGVMMASQYHKQMKAGSYSEVIKEMFKSGVYQSLQNSGVIDEVKISDTPDTDKTPNQGGQKPETDVTIEMVEESDYEFVVKAAKKYNYEFFSVGGTVVFRKAKEDTSKLIGINPRAKIKMINVDYDVTGLVGKMEVRGLDIDKAKPLSATRKNTNSVSLGSKAKSLIADSEYVYVDPTIRSKDEATHRLDYLMEDMTYRYGTLEMDIIGLPDLIPGRFMELEEMGAGISNKFYICNVRHTMDENGEFTTRVTGKAAKAGSSE